MGILGNKDNKTKDRQFQNAYFLLLIFFCFYYCYRYIFKYNSEGTSPTYSNTPLLFQAGKYGIAALFIAFFVLLLFYHKEKIKVGKIEFIILICFICIIIKSVYYKSFDFPIKYFLFAVTAYFIVFIGDFASFEEKLILANKIIFVYHLVYSMIQIALYLFIHRLPALAYENGLIRFGGGWDDPNAFGLYLLIPIGYILCNLLQNKLTGKNELCLWFFLLISLGLEILTFSFAGYFGCVILLIAMIIRYNKKVDLWVLILSLVALICIMGLVFQEKILWIINEKFGSAGLHLQDLIFKISNENFVVGLFFGNEVYTFNENIYNIILQSFGLPVLLLTVVIELLFICVAIKVSKANRDNIFDFMVALFIIAFTICQFGIPYGIIFPMNFIYWSSCFYALAKYRNLQRANKNSILKLH